MTVGTDLQAQASTLSVHANIGTGGTDHCDAMHQRRRRFASCPCATERMPLQHHATPAKVDHQDRIGVIHPPLPISPLLYGAGASANALCTTPAVRICGSTTGSLDPGFEL